MLFGIIVLFAGFFVFLRFLSKQTDEITAYLDEMKELRDRNLFE